MHWGKSIVLVLALSMFMILSMGIYLMTRPTDNYDADYYQRGLNFDRDYIRERQVFLDKAEPQINQRLKTLQVHFKNPIDGKIKCRIFIIRPSSGKMDTNFSIYKRKGSDWILNGNFLAKGNWQLILEWNQGQHDYLFHKEIFWN